ncbi:hypothetical protein SAMN06265222_111133 [Neorhodopirellula lusitana]|uniref:SGNH hydrolase-type esterase domain-containing protein n=1 Tax=Neorhodopirellula lusitana TaxID=445327 RepID=A0ABY1QEN0_9BACT|nr:SGNH/GDSL hydrolase family protein [Neorhodopirellula lusitana]SMP68926.1 hypothetical protein SAMN06265222_111133 [Neorhodopirellula lusitana]
MKKLRYLVSLSVLFACAVTSATLHADSPQPVWELGQDTTDSAQSPSEIKIKGDIDLQSKLISIDGDNTFTLPAKVLGSQTEYTIEFEVQRPIEMQSGHAIVLISNSDPESNAGIKLVYHPPAYNAAWLYCNGYRTIEQRGFLHKNFTKLTLVVKDSRLSLFRDGLILAVTDAIQPSSLPLTFGGAHSEQRMPQAYQMRHVKVHSKAVFPPDFDPSVKRMRNYSGDQYVMQRVEITDPLLPRILVVGDSISMGYRRFITEHFEGRAYVDYWVGSGVEWYGKDINEPDAVAAKAWTGVLSHGPYDVISWNAMTLHWWHTEQTQRCPEDSLARNIGDAVDFLKKHAPDTDLIWVRCTPIRANLADGTPSLDNPNNERVTRYNQMVDEVMHQKGIPEVDLNPIAAKQLHTISKGSNDTLHWGLDNSRLFAHAIVEQIELTLVKRQELQGKQR